MATLPTNRTSANTEADHLGDTNEVHRLHNILDGSSTPSTPAPDATSTVKGRVQLAGDLAGTAAAPTVPGLAAKAADAAVLHIAGAETKAGVLTLSSPPVVPAGTWVDADINAAAAIAKTKVAGTALVVGDAPTAHAASHAPGGSDATRKAGRKTADQNIVDATLVNITDLSVAVAANEHLSFDALVVYDSTVTNDVQVAITVPSGATVLWTGLGPTTATAAGTSFNVPASTNFSVTAAGNTNYGGARAAGASRVKTGLLIRGTVVNGSTAGNLQIQAAKALNTDTTTPADDLLVYANSWLIASALP